MRAQHKLGLVIVLVIVLASAGCPNVQSAIVLPDTPSLFLRATPDGDASSIVGAFIDDDVADAQVDESKLKQTRCSKYFAKKVIPATGRMKEVMGASAGASAKLGVKGIADVNVGGTRGSAMLVYYDVFQKMIAEIDADGLVQCCNTAPDQCTKRYVSSSVMGQGGYYNATESANNVGVSADIPAEVPIDIGAVYQDSLKWERRAQFKRQYFAFSFAKTPIGPAPASAPAASCDWANNVPTDLDGQYFVGVSNPQPFEKMAREDAMRDAREQVVHYLGEWLTESSTSTAHVSSADLQASFDETTTKEAIAQGLARLVKDRKWCGPVTAETPLGVTSTMKVLAFFPNAERAAASKSALESLIAVKKGKHEPTAALEAALAALP